MSYDDQFKKILENKELADEMEKISPGIKPQMAGYLMRSWLPSGIVRKSITVSIALIAILGGIFYDFKLFFLLLAICIFSPRMVGEIVFFLGKISKK